MANRYQNYMGRRLVSDYQDNKEQKNYPDVKILKLRNQLILLISLSKLIKKEERKKSMEVEDGKANQVKP